MTKPTITRRAALTGGVAIAASVSLPALASTPDDTHLLALIGELRRAIAEAIDVDEELATARDRAYAECPAPDCLTYTVSRDGDPVAIRTAARLQADDSPIKATPERIAAAQDYEARLKPFLAKHGVPEIEFRAAWLEGRMDALYAEIPRTRAHTLHGLQAKLKFYFDFGSTEYADALAGNFGDYGDENILASLIPDVEGMLS